MADSKVLAAALLLLAAAAPAGAPVPGHGAFAVTMEVPAGLPTHTLYLPHSRGGTPAPARWPVVVWANGGCSDAGNGYAPLLGEIASHGYVVVALGTVKPPAPRPAPPPPRPAASAAADLARAVAESRGKPPPTEPAQLSQAIDWAQGAVRTGGLRGRIDPTRVAAAGHSCGGLQAIAASAADPRVRTTVMLNSGIFQQPAVRVDKGVLDRLRGPILYVVGGADDVSHANAEDDFARLTRVPAVKINNALGHGGGLSQPFGGPTAPLVVGWLDWQLKGDRAAARAFTGAGCGLCARPDLTIARKGIR
jgi:dienelactone hydrolase